MEPQRSWTSNKRSAWCWHFCSQLYVVLVPTFGRDNAKRLYFAVTCKHLSTTRGQHDKKNFLPLSPYRETWWFHKVPAICWSPGFNMWPLSRRRHFDQGSWVPQRGEERNRKAARFRTSPTETGNWEKVGEDIDTKRLFKCAQARVLVNVCILWSKYSTVAILFSAAVATWTVDCLLLRHVYYYQDVLVLLTT